MLQLFLPAVPGQGMVTVVVVGGGGRGNVVFD